MINDGMKFVEFPERQNWNSVKPSILNTFSFIFNIFTVVEERSHYFATEILGLVHVTLEKFENAALFLQLGLPSTLIRHENGTFWKRSSNLRFLKAPALRFSVK